MKLPNALLIGAMKSGTTSLHMDLAQHPCVFLANEKEPHSLCSGNVLGEEGLIEYASLYAEAAEEQIRIDASTGYSKRPDYEGVAERACQVLPRGFKAIYIVRHPIDRIVSQHGHEYLQGLVGASIDEEVRRQSRYIQYSRYSYQLEPWIAALGHDRIRVVRFEDYCGSRNSVVVDLWDFLGLRTEGYTVDSSKLYNVSEGKPVRNRVWEVVYQNSFYRQIMRPMLPIAVRLRLMQWLLPKARGTLDLPSPPTIQFLYDELAADVQRLSVMLGATEPLWPDFSE